MGVRPYPRPFQGGEATWMDDIFLEMNRLNDFVGRLGKKKGKETEEHVPTAIAAE